MVIYSLKTDNKDHIVFSYISKNSSFVKFKLLELYHFWNSFFRYYKYLIKPFIISSSRSTFCFISVHNIYFTAYAFLLISSMFSKISIAKKLNFVEGFVKPPYENCSTQKGSVNEFCSCLTYMFKYSVRNMTSLVFSGSKNRLFSLLSTKNAMSVSLKGQYQLPLNQKLN